MNNDSLLEGVKPSYIDERGKYGERKLLNLPDISNSNEVYIDRDIIVLANPEIAKLPNWVIALVAAGALAAALSTAAGLLLVISSSISHDLMKKILMPKITERQELFFARGWNHFLNIKDKSDEQVFSHNDLNKTNILSDNVNIVFIDFEYSSMNSRYCDIARIIESFSFNDNETETFLELYGMEANSNIIKSIDEWSLTNTYIDLIWAYIVDKLYPGAIENNYIVNLEAKLDNKSYKYSNN